MFSPVQILRSVKAHLYFGVIMVWSCRATASGKPVETLTCNRNSSDHMHGNRMGTLSGSFEDSNTRVCGRTDFRISWKQGYRSQARCCVIKSGSPIKHLDIEVCAKTGAVQCQRSRDMARHTTGTAKTTHVSEAESTIVFRPDALYCSKRLAPLTGHLGQVDRGGHHGSFCPTHQPA